jgi:XTP/dITP diphosphohydrolase
MKRSRPPLALATTNANKRDEFAWLLSTHGISLLPVTTSVSEVVEGVTCYQDNALLKAKHWAMVTGQWALGDDTGLEVVGLDGQPGICSARFAGPVATAAQNRALLIERVEPLSRSARRARFVCHLALCNPQGELVARSFGSCHGSIVTQPIGSTQLGYDCLFWMDEYHQTLAAIDAPARWLISHRSQAVNRLIAAWDGRFDRSLSDAASPGSPVALRLVRPLAKDDQDGLDRGR